MVLSTFRSIRSRLLAGYVAVAGLLVLALVVGLISFREVDASYTHTVTVDDSLSDSVNLWVKLMADRETGLRGYLLTGGTEFLQPYSQAGRVLPQTRKQIFNLERSEPSLATRMRAMDLASANWNRWAAAVLAHHRFTGAQAQTSRNATLSEQHEGKRRFDRFRRTASKVVSQLAQQRSSHLALARDVTRRGIILLAGILILLFVVVVLVGLITTRSVIEPVQALRRTADKIAHGDLDQEVSPEGPEELVHLSTAMEQMRRRLRDQIRLMHLIGSTLRPEDVYDEFASLLSDMMPAARVSVSVVDGNDMVTVFASGIGVATIARGARQLRQLSVTSLAVESRQPVIRQDLAALPPEGRFEDEDAIAEAGIHSVAIVPLIANQTVVGTLNVGSHRPNAYTLEILGPIVSLAPLLASSLQNARLYEQLRMTNDELEQVSQFKTEFLATMSHEIRTPMNGVIGMTGLLLDTNLSEDQRNYAEIVRSSGEALLNIINDILDYSRIESGRLDLETMAFDVRNIIEDVVELLSAEASAKGLEIASLVSRSVPQQLLGDPGRLRQVLMNLVGNAIKFTDRGDVLVRARVESETEGTALVGFTVTDTGIGVAAGAVAHLFEPFRQADNSTTRRFGGTGLGLAISKRLVERMGGEIGVESEEGKGSTFWFTTTLGKTSEPSESELSTPVPSGTEAPLSSLRVLVVDDNATNRQIFAYHLEAWGIPHESAADARSGLRVLRAARRTSHPFDVAILDMHMPVVDGVELARAIKAEPDLAGTQLIMAGSSPEVQEEGARSLFEAVLVKPVRQNRLHELLTSFASKRKPTPYRPPELREETPVVGSTGRALVAEDNPVSQKLARILLERRGYRVDVAGNGREAVEAVRNLRYDLVLMDCQMPVMDGFEATRAIRHEEAVQLSDVPLSSHDRHTPIIALTANALPDDEQRCLEAGMDAYLAKPLSPERLDRVLSVWAEALRSASRPGGNGSNQTTLDPGREPIDQEAINQIREMSGDRPDFLRDLIDTFLSDAWSRIEVLRRSVEEEDWDEVARVTHTLKGSARTIGATGLGDQAADMEGKVQRQEPVTGGDVGAMVEEFERVRAALKGIGGEVSA